jgi:hypothetical protein
MERRIYRIVIVIYLVLGVYVYKIKETHSVLFLSTIFGLINFLFSAGFHGLLAHSITPKLKKLYDCISTCYGLILGYFTNDSTILYPYNVLSRFCL